MKFASSRASHILLCAGFLAAALGATGAIAAPIYATGFEQSAFSTGPVAGQANWTGSGVVQTAIVKSGQQALQLNGSSGFVGSDHVLSEAIGSQPYRLTVDFQRTGAQSQSGVAVTGDTGFIAQIGGLGSDFFVGNTNSDLIGPAIVDGLWYALQLDFDFADRTMTASVNGVSMGTLAINNVIAPTQLTALKLFTFGTSGSPQFSYFDNVSLATVPEPASLALAALALCGVFATRSRRQ